MRFTPKSQKELDEERLLPDGQYGFVISDAKNKTSAAGNEMIELTVRVFKPDGNFILISDYLMEKMLYKLLHCCEVCGLTKEYEAGELDPNLFVGKEGYVKIKTQKDKTGAYPDKNVIADYISSDDGAKFTAPKDNLSKALDGDELEDDIPF